MALEISNGAAVPGPDVASCDLAMAWTTEDDAGFVELLDTACRARTLSLLQITPVNLARICQELVSGQLSFRAFFDRASDEDRTFLPIVEWARVHSVYRINPYELARRTWDKAAMHTATSEQVPTPYTLFVPSYHDSPELPDLDLSRLGPSFTIKPAHGGGGWGVVVVATTVDRIVQARQESPDDMYMLQERVVPTKIGTRTAWFRILYAAGQVYPCWWNFDTRQYRPVTVAEEVHYRLTPLRELTKALAGLCALELFSTEIAVDNQNRFVVVDYVNDPVDLTLASSKPDGVPDDLVGFIAEDLADLVAQHRTS
jgi:hypothetical protein